MTEPRKRPALLGPDPCEYLGDKTSGNAACQLKEMATIRGIGVSLDMGLATASVTLERFCDELSRQSGYKVFFLLPPSANVLHQTHIKQHSQKQSAREILRQLYDQIGSKFSWRLRFDPDRREIFLVMEC
jgi:hypothetical protein